MFSLAISLARLGGFLLIAFSLVVPWLRVPIGLSAAKDGVYTVINGEPVTTSCFRLATVALLLVGSWVAFRRRASGTGGKALVITGCLQLIAVVILYPAITVQRCPQIVSHAAWLEMQNESLILPPGDTFTSQEYIYQPGQPEVDVKQVLPRSFAVIPIPAVTSLTDIRLANLARLVMWLGYTPDFCQFIGKGWFCAIAGAMLLAVTFFRSRDRNSEFAPEPNFVYGSMLFLLGGSLVAGLVCLIPILMAGREFDASRGAAERGDFERSLHHIGIAEAWLPIVSYQTDVLYQTGWLELKLNEKSPESDLAFALNLEEEGASERGAAAYAALLEPNTPQPVRAEAYRAELRLAIAEFNSNLSSAADRRLTQLSAIDPTCVKANYALQLWHARIRNKQGLEDDVARFQAIYKSFQSLEKGPLLALAHRRLADLEFDYDDKARLNDEMREAVTP
jgi:hypothetical protein